MSNLINLTLRLGLLTPLHPAAQTPPPPPPPVVVVAPVQHTAAPVASAPSVVAPAATVPPVVLSAPSTTSGTIVYNGTECNVTITDPQGNHVTFSPGPADADGTCASYPASNYGAPGDTVLVSPGPVTSTTGN